MEDVSAIPMHVNALQVFAIKIAAQVRPFIYHQTLLTSLGCHVGEHTTKEPCAYNEKVIFLGAQSHNIRKKGERVR